ncbi:MAG TPA: RiPP maturation radical SAM C-methyltransferase [Thermoanaerobaculia bacterium]|nr:RiPP maturation radical SAM C-methyltransferase [Thermoanaerobaculia bacterium]
MEPTLDVPSLAGGADALIIVPPFAGVDRPSLAAHTLQACARQAGFRVSVLYANLAFARHIGDSNYEGICFGDTTSLLGERFFAAAAYGLPSFGRDDPAVKVALGDLSSQVQLDPDIFRRLEAEVPAWCDQLVDDIIRSGSFPVIGCSSTFEQTSASMAILKRVKAAKPTVITILGGANCEGEMAGAVLALGTAVDYIFSGESEVTFPQFLREVRSGGAQLPAERVFVGTPCVDLDSLPTPDFAEYFDQRQRFLPDSPYTADDTVWIPYESSRGCWWGQKHHCTFCGINGGGMQFREKSADRVITELRSLIDTLGSRRFCMVDNIMPYQYFRSLIPRLGSEVPDLHLFYEQKANLSLEQVMALKAAGVARMQPGIEALSSDLLRLMDKGVTTRQNVALLRYCRAVDMDVSWNLLYAFPGDRAEWYRETLELLPLIRHLKPPEGVCHLSIDRFSPYHFASARYGIRNVRALPSYAAALPAHARVEEIAYHFYGDYESDSKYDTDLIRQLEEEVDRWRAAWQAEGEATPSLQVIRVTGEHFLLLDSRGLPGLPQIRFLTRDQAMAAVTGSPASTRVDDMAEALASRIAVKRDGWYVPLATASPELMREFEYAARQNARSVVPLPLLGNDLRIATPV